MACRAPPNPRKDKQARPRGIDDPDDLRWLRDNSAPAVVGTLEHPQRFQAAQSLRTSAPRAAAQFRAPPPLPRHICMPSNSISTRNLSSPTWRHFRNRQPLKFRELWALLPAMELVLLEQVAMRAKKVPGQSGRRQQSAFAFAACVKLTNSIGKTCSSRTSLSIKYCGRIRQAPTPNGF